MGISRCRRTDDGRRATARPQRSEGQKGGIWSERATRRARGEDGFVASRPPSDQDTARQTGWHGCDGGGTAASTFWPSGAPAGHGPPFFAAADGGGGGGVGAGVGGGWATALPNMCGRPPRRTSWPGTTAALVRPRPASEWLTAPARQARQQGQDRPARPGQQARTRRARRAAPSAVCCLAQSRRVGLMGCSGFRFLPTPRFVLASSLPAGDGRPAAQRGRGSPSAARAPRRAG